MAHRDCMGSMIFSDELAANANRVVLLKNESNPEFKKSIKIRKLIRESIKALIG